MESVGEISNDQGAMNRHVPPWAFSTVAFGIITTVRAGCTCRETMRSEEKSPSGENVATVTTVECGVPAGSMTQVNIRYSNASFSSRDGVVLTVDEKQPISIARKDNHTLFIYGPKELLRHDFVDNRIKIQRFEVKGVQIEYQPL